MASRFPTLTFIFLAFAIVWLVSELGYLTFKVPWLPIILIIILVGMIFNRFR